MVAHVRPLPRAIDGEVTQHDGGDAELLVRSAQVLGRQLGHAIGRDRPRRQRLVAGAVAAVNRRRGRVDQPFELGVSAHRFEQPLRGVEVAALVQIEIGPALDQARHRRQMKNHLNAIQRGSSGSLRRSSV